jgi:glycosyltransferase involved in cell wall biosynthesis
VVAWQHGSVSEVIEPGVTGCLCEDVGAAVRAVNRIKQLSRSACRASFERRFTAERMARNYLALYQRVAAGGQSLPDLREAVL